MHGRCGIPDGMCILQVACNEGQHRHAAHLTWHLWSHYKTGCDETTPSACDLEHMIDMIHIKPNPLMALLKHMHCKSVCLSHYPGLGIC